MSKLSLSPQPDHGEARLYINGELRDAEGGRQ